MDFCVGYVRLKHPVWIADRDGATVQRDSRLMLRKDANRIAVGRRVAADRDDVQQPAVERTRMPLGTSTQSAPASVPLAIFRSHTLPLFKLKLAGLLGAEPTLVKSSAPGLGSKSVPMRFISRCQEIAVTAGVSSSSPPVRLMLGVLLHAVVGDVIPDHAVLNRQLAARHIERGSRFGIIR